LQKKQRPGNFIVHLSLILIQVGHKVFTPSHACQMTMSKNSESLKTSKNNQFVQKLITDF